MVNLASERGSVRGEKERWSSRAALGKGSCGAAIRGPSLVRGMRWRGRKDESGRRWPERGQEPSSERRRKATTMMAIIAPMTITTG